MYMTAHNGKLQNIWLSKGAHKFMSAVWGGTESVKQYFSLKKTNDELALKIFDLQQQIRHYENITGNDFHMDNAAGKTVGNFQYIPATISKLSSNKQHNYMIIDKGSEDGVLTDSGVITDKGVVGIVESVSRHYCYAISFANTTMNVSARIGRDGSVGSLSWDGKSMNGSILKEIPPHIEVEKGDTVFTSGFSALFPADIPLGITGDKKLVNGASFEIKVKLFEDFSALRYVTIVKNLDVDEINILEE